LHIPPFDSAELLADKFINFFKSKKTIMRQKIVSDSPNITYNISMGVDIMFNGKMFEMSRPASEVED